MMNLDMDDLKHVRQVLKEDVGLHHMQRGSMGEDDARHDKRIADNERVLARIERIVGPSTGG